MIYDQLNSGTVCCQGSITTEQQLMMDYLYQIHTCIETSLDKAYAKELYGYDSECSFNKINDLFYLFDILMWIYRDWQLNPTNTKETYYEMFNIDCWKKTFMCCGCNISAALTVFGLDDAPFTPVVVPEYEAEPLR